MEDVKVLITAHSFGSCGKAAFDILDGAKVKYSIMHRKEIFKEEDLIDEVKSFDALIVGADVISRKVIENAPKLRIISKHGVGLDNIDLEAAKERNIVVAAAIGSNNIAVAELTICLMLALARRVALCDREVKAGEWNRYKGMELMGSTLGVIGTGKIGKEVIARMKSFGMNVLAFDLNQDKGFAKEYNVKYVPLNELLAQADFLCIHAPLTDSTKYLINKSNLIRIKRTAILINTARGGIVDEDALYSALINKEIAGAAIDTFEYEPPGRNRLLELDNVIATPHIGAYTKEAIDKMSKYSAEAIAQFAKGENIKNKVI
ncbi:MAG: hypothetical protein APF77_07280 [Clostridia bacterium BRH_c25]|nr:MAG: hypothetical protein APF77_07280 [Clostridia bacterium BRH_c25]